MEVDANCGQESFSGPESTFDRIDSPQYINFNDFIPEPQDSYFERTKGDHSVEQQNSKKLQRLPTDSEEDLMLRYEESENENENDSRERKNNNGNNQGLPSDFGNDLIQAVQAREVNASGTIPEKILTSTPFCVKGVKPMPWRLNPKPAETRHCTQVKPFSFEERNKHILERKARRVQAILQAEKDARKFRATPVPKFLRKIPPKNNSTSSNSHHNGEHKNKTAETQQLGPAPPPFKARSATVLRKPAFQPNLPRQPLLLPQPFVLHSELRAKEREVFDNYIKEKEHLDERLRALREAAQKRREEEEIVRMRKQMVIKAQPVRKFKCVTEPVAKRPLTEPVTPKVVKRQRR